MFIFAWKYLCEYDTILLSIYKLCLQQTSTPSSATKMRMAAIYITRPSTCLPIPSTKHLHFTTMLSTRSSAAEGSSVSLHRCRNTRPWQRTTAAILLHPGARSLHGEQLATDVYLPGSIVSDRLLDSPAISAGPFSSRVPAVLVRTPYGKYDGVEQYYRFVQRGYAVVVQDVRGREDSTGKWLPNHYEVEDGNDTLNWIAAQPWSDGGVAMTGGSYLGYVQWAAASPPAPWPGTLP